jgi:hypothetical protein
MPSPLQEEFVLPVQNGIEEDVIEEYDRFCRQYGMDSRTAKSCEVFKIYLKYRIHLTDDALRATLSKIKQKYKFGAHG